MKKIYLITLLIIIANASVFAQKTPTEVFFELGNKRLELKQYDQAIDYFTKCIKASPDEAVCYNNRAIAYREKSDYTRAIADFTEAIKYLPNKAEIYNGRAIAYRRAEKYDLAIADLETSLKINPAEPSVKRMLELVKEQKTLSERIKTMGMVYPTTPNPNNNAQAADLLKRGKEQMEKKDSGAIQSFSECLRLKPNSADCYFYRGVFYHRDKQYEKAVTDFTEALKLQPNNVEYYRNRANSYGNNGLKKYDAAIADLTEVIRLQPKDSQSYTDRGHVHRDKKDYQKAEEDFTNAINLETDPLRKQFSYQTRAYMHYNYTKNYLAAIADYTEYIKIDPKDWTGYANRGGAYLRNKNFEKAVADYTKSLELGTVYPETAYAERGQAYCALGKKALGLADKKKAQELGKKDVDLGCQPVR